MSIPLQAEGMHIRPATLRDVDALASIMCEAMPLDPQWDYRYSLRKKYPEDLYGYTRLMIKSRIEDNSHFIDIVTFPSPGLAEEDEVPAALAISVVLKGSDASPSADDGGPRRDINLEHMNAAKVALDAAKRRYFADLGPERIHLRVLAVRPDFQRRGAGAALCKRVLGRATEQKRSVTLIASPMGRPLYSSLGFSCEGSVHIQTDGEEEKLSVGAMVFRYRDEERKLHDSDQLWHG